MGIISGNTTALAVNYGVSAASTIVTALLSDTVPLFVDAANTAVYIKWTGMEKPKDRSTLLTEAKYADMAEIKRFADDQNAIRIEPVTTMKTGRTYAGRLTSWDDIEIVRVTLSVLPHTTEEKCLSQLALDQDDKLFKAYAVEVSDEKWDIKLRIVQKKMSSSSIIPLMTKVRDLSTTFEHGRLVGITGGYGDGGMACAHSIRGERLESSQYVFEFSKWKNEDGGDEIPYSLQSALSVGASASRFILS